LRVGGEAPRRHIGGSRQLPAYQQYPHFQLGKLASTVVLGGASVTDRRGGSGVDTGVWRDGSWIGGTSTASSWWLCPPLHSIGSRNRWLITKFFGSFALWRLSCLTAEPGLGLQPSYQLPVRGLRRANHGAAQGDIRGRRLRFGRQNAAHVK
jgi:hypothetical protein